MANKRSHRYEFRLNDIENERLIELAKNQPTKVDYIRKCIFRPNSSLINPVDFIRVMDESNLEMKRIGNNINQVAKYLNQRKDVPSDNLLMEYNNLLDSYIKIQFRLEKAYGKLITKMIK